MKARFFSLFCFVFLVGALVVNSSFIKKDNIATLSFPYNQAGLTKKQAAEHLLSRFTYGVTPELIDEVTKVGLENWFEDQLQADDKNESLNRQLAKYEALNLNNNQIVNSYPKTGTVVQMAIKDGVVNQDSIKVNRKKYNDVLQNYMKEHGMKPEQDLYTQLINQRILRATFSKNQLQEVMTAFWFNHFYVSMVKAACSQFILSYEKDVIRPNALGKFSNLVLTTAKSPAMLYYLDNAGSMASQPIKPSKNSDILNKAVNPPALKGLNENYARELIELHTLGVDGGYSQADVTQTAKILTGWTVVSFDKNNPVDEDKLKAIASFRDGDFLFMATRHDKSEKVVLGRKFSPSGYEEGVELLNMLANHKSAAKFISRKIAVRFVSDNPPVSLINKMAATFIAQGGDIKQVLITMVNSAEFWNASSLHKKIKSPFELAVSTARSLHADVQQPYQLYNWINKMGESIYSYQAPTGYPDMGKYWINTGALLYRMNFGMTMSSGKIPGIKIDLLYLNNNHEPESAKEALRTFSSIIIPERAQSDNIKRLAPLLNDPELEKKISNATSKLTPASKNTSSDEILSKAPDNLSPETSISPTSMLSQVVGVIIGSPEYQRR